MVFLHKSVIILIMTITMFTVGLLFKVQPAQATVCEIMDYTHWGKTLNSKTHAKRNAKRAVRWEAQKNWIGLWAEMRKSPPRKFTWYRKPKITRCRKTVAGWRCKSRGRPRFCS